MPSGHGAPFPHGYLRCRQGASATLFPESGSPSHRNLFFFRVRGINRAKATSLSAGGLPREILLGFSLSGIPVHHNHLAVHAPAAARTPSAAASWAIAE